jgi:hypothetical protein
MESYSYAVYLHGYLVVSSQPMLESQALAETAKYSGEGFVVDIEECEEFFCDEQGATK